MSNKKKKTKKQLAVPKNLTKSYLENFIKDIVTQCYNSHTFFLGYMQANKKVFDKYENLREQALGIDGTFTDIAEQLKEMIENIKTAPKEVTKDNSASFAMAELTLQTISLTLNSVSVTIIPDLYVQVMEVCEKDPSLAISIPEGAKEGLAKIISAASKQNEKHKKLALQAVENMKQNEGEEYGK